MTISLTGFMGCGKSSTGRELAVRRGARFVDLDEEIVAREGRSIPEIFREGGEAAFRAAELRALLQADPYPDRVTVEALDRAYIAENLSPGGSADLLALCFFLHFLKEDFP